MARGLHLLPLLDSAVVQANEKCKEVDRMQAGMQAPKILPWLARKAGVSDTCANALWQEANRFAAVQAGATGTSEYWKAATSRLVELFETRPGTCGFIGHMLRTQSLMGVLSLNAFEGFALVAVATWRRLLVETSQVPAVRNA